MTVVSLYARVSSKRQAQGDTIGSQLADLESRIDKDGYELLSEYKFIDNGYSGSNLKRPGLCSLRGKVAEGKIGKVYIHSPDRLSREPEHLEILREEFRESGTEIIFLNFQMDNSPESKLSFRMQGISAKHGNLQMVERNRQGKICAAREGRVSVMSNAPYGYRYVRHIVREKARFEINEKEAKIVRKLFAWVGQERVTLREAVQRLKEMRIITPKGKRDWHPSAISRILKNPAYKGQAAFGKTKVGPIKKEVAWEMREKNYSVYHNDRKNWIHIAIPSIIEEELFDAVQEQLAENRKRARVQKGKETSLLQGLVVCCRCGYTYHSIKSGDIKRSYYRCSGLNLYYCYSETRRCSSKPIRAEMLETPVWEEVKSLLKEPDRIIKEYQHRISEHKKPLDKTFEKQEGRLNRSIEILIDGYTPKHNLEEEESGLNKIIERLTYDYNKGDMYISKEGFESLMKEREQDLEKVKKQKEKIKDQEAVQRELASIANSLKRFSSSIKPELDQLHWIDRRSVIKKLVKRIEVSLDRITIVFRIKELV